MSCQVCKDDPTYATEWGCVEPTQTAVWDDQDGEVFYNCPLRFIPDVVLEWYDEYSYYKECPGSAPPYAEQTPRFIEAIGIYRLAFRRYTEALRPNKDKQASNLDVFRQTVAQRKQDG